MIYIFTDNHKNGGTETWLNNLCECFDILNQQYEVVRNNDYILISNASTIIINNCKYDLTNLLEESKCNVYFVIHSDICPSNGYLIKYLKYVDNIIFVNKNISKKLIPKLKNLKETLNYFILENFVNFSVNVKKINKEKHNNKKIFNYVGRLSPEKNIPMLLYSFAEIDKTKWVLNIYGNTTDERYYCIIKNVIASLNIIDNVIFHGFIEDKNIIYSNCDYIILPSISEGSSYALIESLSYGIPVIAINNVGDNNERITEGQNGYLIDINCFVDIGESIFINDYTEILKKIGYIETFLMHDYDGDGCFSLNRNKIILPPNLYKIKRKKFDENIYKIKLILEKAINNNITFEPVKYDKNKIINDIKKIFVK